MAHPAEQRSIVATSGGSYAPLALLLAAMAAGMVIDRYYSLPAEGWWLASALGLILWWAMWLAKWDRAGSLVLLLAVLAAGGAWRHDRWHYFADDEIGLSLTEEIRPHVVEGLVIASPRWVPAPPMTALRTVPKGDETEVLLWMTAIRDGRVWRPTSGWAALDVDGHLLGVRAGDRVRITALTSLPMKPLNPGEFDYAAYLRSQRMFCRLRGLFPESVTIVQRGSLWSPRHWLGTIREQGNILLRRHIRGERSTLAAAILIGAREQIDPERTEGFLVTGTIHILSISGLHVGILAYGFWLLFRTGLLPRRMALSSAMVLTVLYAVLTDLNPPVVRAAILVLVMCGATWLGRRGLGVNALAAAGVVVLAYNPLSLFLAGTQLSFLAVLAMIVFSPILSRPRIVDPLDRLLASVRPWPVRAGRFALYEVWRVWLTGAVIWLVSLPLIWQQYGLVSPIALLLNTVIWLPVTLSLYAGFGVLALGWAVPPLAGVFGWMCDQALWMIEASIRLVQDVPGSHFWFPAPPWWWSLSFYVVLAVLALFPAWRPRKLWCAALASTWLAGAILLAGNLLPSLLVRPADRPLACTFVAVGHGTSCLLELPDGQTLLYDAGRLGSPLGAARPIAAVLWSRGITHLDAVVISHADSDHFNGLPELLTRFDIGAIYTSPVMFEGDAPAVAELRRAIELHRVPLLEISAGERLKSSVGVTLEVLHPPRKGVVGSDNANSIVLLASYCNRHILLPGDLESPGLDDLLAELPLDCDIVMAPHHGSRRSDPAGFANWSTPEFVVLSGERDVEDFADIESVKDSYRQRGAVVFHTAQHGAVRFELRPQGIDVTTLRQVVE